MRAREDIPQGDFDLKHLKAIHRHLFQDIFEWAGQVRTVEISKGESQFQFRQYIETGMADVYRRVVKSDFLRGLERSAFAAEAARIMGDVNYVHPFREGNAPHPAAISEAAFQAGGSSARPDEDRSRRMAGGIERGPPCPIRSHGTGDRRCVAPDVRASIVGRFTKVAA
ncbi:Fic/DOC family protein [Neorhizobium sp. 2083]|uniref:Fic/DOC family protein n=1 Tax=Neorhizobium sp. 2083 TaxID=2817762 RepID=UPI00386207C5